MRPWRAIPVVLALVAMPSAAGAATTVGQTFVPATAGTCNGNSDWQVLQTGRADGLSYSVPAAGVLTSWSFQPGAAETSLTLRVLRPAGTPQQYTPIADAGLKTVPGSSGLHTFPARIPVQAGDLIGIRSTTGTCATETGNPADAYDFLNGDPAPLGAVATFTHSTAGFIWDIAASLEPDCDRDGLGDETQDSNLASCFSCRGRAATIVGTEGPDRLSGTPAPDVIAALGGNDRVFGFAGNDLICGGEGRDILRGGKGRDILLGEAGRDVLKGGPGRDRLIGGPGRDRRFQQDRR